MFTNYKLFENEEFRLGLLQNDDESQQSIDFIRKALSEILRLNPELEIPSQYSVFFSFLEDILNSRKFNSQMHQIIPPFMYPQLISFFRLTNNHYVHLIFSRILITLSCGSPQSLTVLLDNDILNAVRESLFKKEFVFSFEYLFQIIANFLNDEDGTISISSYELFNDVFLFHYFDYFTENLETSLASAVLFRWMKSVVAILQIPSVSDNAARYQSIMNSFLEKVSKCQSIINEQSADLLCDCLSVFLDAKLINFDIFNRLCYPNFLLTLSYFDNMDIQSKALKLIRQLISNNSFVVGIGYYDLLDQILQSTENDCVEDRILVCASFYENSNLAEKAFEGTSDNLSRIIEYANGTTYQTKNGIIKLLSKHLEYMCQNTETHQALPAQLDPILAFFFDYLDSADDFETAWFPLNALICFCDFLEKTGQWGKPEIQSFFGHFYMCIDNVKNQDLNEDCFLALQEIQEKLKTLLPSE